MNETLTAIHDVIKALQKKQGPYFTIFGHFRTKSKYYLNFKYETMNLIILNFSFVNSKTNAKTRPKGVLIS